MWVVINYIGTGPEEVFTVEKPEFQKKKSIVRRLAKYLYTGGYVFPIAWQLFSVYTKYNA